MSEKMQVQLLLSLLGDTVPATTLEVSCACLSLTKRNTGTGDFLRVLIGFTTLESERTKTLQDC